jgi:cyclophilin family peptidyl-prolyl cis-trans isomerase
LSVRAAPPAIVVLGRPLLVWALLSSGACSRSGAALSPPARDAGATPGAGDAPSLLAAIARAEDLRCAKDLPADAQRSHEPSVRRAAARALARILDADDGPLLRALEDDDPEVVAWAGYGLGETCKGREESHVRAIAARLSSRDGDRRALPVMLRALGRCGEDLAERTLRVWLLRGAEGAEAAAYALGEIAARSRALSIESSVALLDAAEGSPPLDAALYAFGRAEDAVVLPLASRTDPSAGSDLRRRVGQAARAALGRPGPERIFGVRALSRAGDADAASELARILSSDDYTPPERADAAHGLARLRKAGQSALADALGSLVPARADALAGDRLGLLLAAVGAVSDDPPKKAETALWAMARLEPPPDAPPAIVRRASALRCRAAERLARGAWDSDILGGCDLADGSVGELAQLTALDRGPLLKAKRAAWKRLARSPHLRVREAAIEAIGRHPELGDAGRAVIAGGLTANEPGVVAVAAELVEGHPDRVVVLADSERRAALDPQAPSPTAAPARELDKDVARALKAALARPWSEDLVETRVALLDAALTTGLDGARAFASTACKDPNATIRARAAKALAAAGEKGAACPAPDRPGSVAPEIGHELPRPVRVVFDTEGGSLAVRFDPALAPVSVTRLIALARSGFYTGVVVHRVVPGFVVQLGDRGGDGYGGSGSLLRGETSPVPFGPLDVGVAVAGRDTASSQIFITLARYPHLDGQYTQVGHAEGDWNAVAEGDLITAVRVEE